jgi:TorA maturation chaperone TorD
MESIAAKTAGPAGFAAYPRIRTDSYALLASLLGRPPSENLLQVLQHLEWEDPIPEKLALSLGALRRASYEYPLGAMGEEYDRLFVGLGSGEMIPYASWYRGKKIQSYPLAVLRADLALLGIVRQAESHESEDHAEALCECMALISQQPREIPPPAQARFFQQHLAPWMTAFFQDLELAKNARFYRTVGAFGRCFLESENEYLRGCGGS